MTKKRKITVAAVLTILTAAITACIVFFVCADKGKKLHIVDSTGADLATVTKISPLEIECENDSYTAYIDIVIDEAIDYIAQRENCDTEKAQKILMKSGYTINTAFDTQAFYACENAYSLSDLDNTSFAASITDLNGRLLCAFSSSNEENYAAEKTQPYSSFKPLSVYAPAIENGVALWSTLYEDTPVKKVKSENGGYVDWPVNGNGKYQNKGVTVCEGIKLSLNTTAVRCLQNLGVSNSIDFLRRNFDIDLRQEENIISLKGEEEVLANIGMGYLRTGVSPVDMAGFYQIFANGGNYIKPYTVVKITDTNGETVYENKSEAKRIISEDTAYIMNKLLQNTLTRGGTAEKARYKDALIGGKTGTGTNYAGNWFVGFTPEYSFSIWHGTPENGKNNCAEIFPLIAEKLELGKEKTFPISQNVKKIPYCAETGKALTMNCNKMEIGYYMPHYTPEMCDEHK